jgi:16S rRNA (cytosine967-C5)-methyltransferase
MKPSISPARTAAFDVLFRVEAEHAFTSILLPLHEKGLSNVDRALCHELVLGVLRRQIWLDRVIDILTDGKRVEAEVRIALRLGVYQLQFLSRVPPHSAVNESVELVRWARKTSAKGFVNAVLRRFANGAPRIDYRDELERLSVENSHPPWLIERWIRTFGLEEAEKQLCANNDAGPLAFRVLNHNSETDRLVAKARKSDAVTGCYVLDGPSAELVQLAEEGLLYIQDEGSQLVAASVEIPASGCVLDVCGAPGGKTGWIARANPSALIVAGDLYAHRLKLLRDNLRRQFVSNTALVRHNAEAELPFKPESFEAVLVDAPCSGTGTIRRNPEIRYSLRPSDIDELASKQRHIVENASKLVEPGGQLIYSTCSLETEENEQVVAAFLETTPGFALARPRVPDRFITGEGFARTFPYRDGMDGFFIADLRRRSS